MHKIKKRFGQNFLIDQIVIDNIIKTIAPKKNDNMIEIGAGLGALTLPLLNKLNVLKIIEIDNDLIKYWHKLNKKNLIINQADILNFDIKSLGTNLRIIGNLPYNISTPILFKMITLHANIKDMVFMLQKEVAQRIVAPPNNKTYGRLSVMMQAFFEVNLIFTVPPIAFNPMPKIESAIIYLKPKIDDFDDFDDFSLIVKTSFSTRRKILKNCLKNLISEKDTNINLNLRAENLNIVDFKTLTKDYVNLRNR